MRSPLPFLLKVASILLLLVPAPGRAQDDQFWTSVGINRTVASRFNIKIEQQLRLKEQLSTFHKTFAEISLAYRANERFSAVSSYRHITAPDGLPSRVSLAGTYKFSLGLLSLSYRLKLQREYEADLPPEDAVRNRLGLGYQINSGLSSYFQVELAHEDEGAEFVYRKYRLIGGVRVKLTAVHSVRLFILYQKIIATDPPGTIFVFGALYQITL